MKKEDPLGNACLTFMEGVRGEEIEVFCSITEQDVIPVDYLFRAYDEMPKVEQIALSLCKGTVLDVGAGAGSHALWLQDKGIETYALDVSEGAAEAMKKQGVKEVVCSNFYTLEEHKKFDTLLFLMNGIGIAGTLEGLPEFFNKCLRLLKDGGQILLDSTDLIYLIEGEDYSEENEGYLGEVAYQMKYKNSETGWFNWLYIDQEKLKDVCNKMNLNMEVIIEANYNFLVKITR
ncbi:MAG: class I SAM-dependent methyltransferase [Flavobacteriales bacterium]|jgi:SAM-dependent methyltransferase|nr:class I SAM-dependent methyltransferase [Flavobacteriales bacterium]